ncbi:TPA: methyltransferase [Candidatus Woesearchaeota archaeon]|nr:methyltransferase [Candidatus Woesearchaeota archaeon]
MIEKLSNAWREGRVFEQQLEFNNNQLTSVASYALHWRQSVELILALTEIQNKPLENILDIGCGCGAFFEVCKRHLPLLHYSGTDYSESAIKLAQETWNGGNFFVKDVKELTKEDIENYDLVYTSALFDVMPDGDEALEHLLQLSAKNIILSRMKTTDDESYYEEYEAYGITTCAFHHNKSNLLEMCDRYNYEVRQFADDHFLLMEKSKASLSDINKAKSNLNWQPKVKLEDWIDQTKESTL